MIVALTGKTACGKTTLAKKLRADGFKQIVAWTTRPRRPGEVDGEDYNYVSPEDFNALKDSGFFAETITYRTTFGDWSYGTAKGDYQDGCFVILTPKGVKLAEESIGFSLMTVYLDCDEAEVQQRLKNRGDNPLEINRRLQSDAIDFAGFKPDVVLSQKDVNTISKMLEDCISP